jgi:hypothetical protein
MAAVALSPAVTRAGLAPTAIRRAPTCLYRRTYFQRAQPAAQRALGRRPFSQQAPKRPKPSGKIEWYPIPIGLGIGFLGLVQFYKVYSREQEKESGESGEPGQRPKKRPRIRPEGPWYAFIVGINVDQPPLTYVLGRSRLCRPFRSRQCLDCGADLTSWISPTISESPALGCIPSSSASSK